MRQRTGSLQRNPKIHDETRRNRNLPFAVNFGRKRNDASAAVRQFCPHHQPSWLIRGLPARILQHPFPVQPLLPPFQNARQRHLPVLFHPSAVQRTGKFGQCRRIRNPAMQSGLEGFARLQTRPVRRNQLALPVRIPGLNDQATRNPPAAAEDGDLQTVERMPG